MFNLNPGTPVSSANKTDRQDIIEILLKVTLNSITLTHSPQNGCTCLYFSFLFLYFAVLISVRKLWNLYVVSLEFYNNFMKTGIH